MTQPSKIPGELSTHYGPCPYCGSAISCVTRDGTAYARCSHRGCGARGPIMRSLDRAVELFRRGRATTPEPTDAAARFRARADSADAHEVPVLASDDDARALRVGRAALKWRCDRCLRSPVEEGASEYPVSCAACFGAFRMALAAALREEEW